MAVAVAEEKAKEREAQQRRDAKAMAESAMRKDDDAESDDAESDDEFADVADDITTQSVDEGTAVADALAADAAGDDVQAKSA